MDWTEIAYPTGSPDTGKLGFRVIFRLPDARGDEPSTDRQADAIMMFYGQSFGNPTRDQAKAMLACRDFALASARSIFPRYPPKLQTMMATALAAFLQSDGELLSFAVEWSDAAYARGSGSPRVRGAPIFPGVEAFAQYLEGMMELEGWTSEHYNGFR